MNNSRENYKKKIDAIAKGSFNNDQKNLAKKILDQVDEKILEDTYRFISQRVKTGFTFDVAPEVNKNAVAILKEREDLKITTNELNSIEHTLIIGENYDALKNLLVAYTDPKTRKGLIDLIYIDPPYNTDASKKEGNDYKEAVSSTKFIYRDKFTRDGWLNMLNERLNLAKKLLKDDGVIFISLDDTMQAYMKVLCDEIFGEENFIATFIIDKTAQGANNSDTFKTQHEFLHAYSKNLLESKNKININVDIEKDEKSFKYKDSKGWYAITNKFDSINSPLIKNKLRGYTVYYRELDNDVKVIDEYNYEENKFCSYDEKLLKEGYFPIRPSIRNGIQYPWNWEKERFLREYKTELVFKNDREGKMHIYHKNRYTGKVKDTTIQTFDTRQYGNQLLMDILGEKRFEFPKSLDMMKWVVSKCNKKDSIVLDFYAGSGTTAQAVMELNKEDGGKRKAIIVTNNENNIAYDITRERLYRVIMGKGSNDEKIKWRYNNETPSLKNNVFKVFELEYYDLQLNDFEKAKEIKEKAIKEFKKINADVDYNGDIDIYYELSCLNPYKEEKNEIN
ncbi:MAG TPA: site-specific DNA-methyltransferase [Acholeplasmataceae bacterium]|nr:site-specific DNA-methyltransferase [Acholeplasmataceae bacterium]